MEHSSYNHLRNDLVAQGYVPHTHPIDNEVDESEECPYCCQKIAFHSGFRLPGDSLSYVCYAVCGECGSAFEF
jgi:hypothetical protein